MKNRRSMSQVLGAMLASAPQDENGKVVLAGNGEVNPRSSAKRKVKRWYEYYKNMRSTKYKPHHGPKEAARRLRQIERGMLKL